MKDGILALQASIVRKHGLRGTSAYMLHVNCAVVCVRMLSKEIAGSPTRLSPLLVRFVHRSAQVRVQRPSTILIALEGGTHVSFDLRRVWILGAAR